MSDVLIFAGTIEGRLAAEYLGRHQINTYVCVATEYGESLISDTSSLQISHDRLTMEQMCVLMQKEMPQLVIDATHPYAAEVTTNIREACKRTQLKYIRLLRSGYQVTDTDVIYADSVPDAIEKLKNTSGNILATTGSKEIAAYTALPDYKERVFARVLSLPKVTEQCAALGFEGRNLICMQGPFSLEMNAAMLRQYDCRYLVTKESGSTGGFMEKYEAAKQAGATLVLIGRPLAEEGLSLSECKKMLQKHFSLPVEQKISLVGIGMGTRDGMTVEALNTCKQADLIIGASRMTEWTAHKGQAIYNAYKAQEIADYIKEHPEYEKIAIVLSGDVGFYSGAKKLLELLPENTKILPGISSMIAFAAKLKMPWEDACVCSLHGRSVNLINKVKEHTKVFAIVGNETGIGEICSSLVSYGMDEVIVHIGERLGYEDERITSKTAKELAGCQTDALSVVMLQNEKAAKHIVTHGIPDTEFLRDKAPMTKEEIRDISLSKLRLKKDSLIYDVGAGTGSVSIEMARMASDGHVYAVEKKTEAVALLHKNKAKFAAENLTILEGLAPEALDELPNPTHAFIGGSSGNLHSIVAALLKKNPMVRIVINCITLETVMETLECIKAFSLQDVDIAAVSSAKSKEIGSYHMMMGQNPVYIISCEGGKACP